MHKTTMLEEWLNFRLLLQLAWSDIVPGSVIKLATGVPWRGIDAVRNRMKECYYADYNARIDELTNHNSEENCNEQ